MFVDSDSVAGFGVGDGQGRRAVGYFLEDLFFWVSLR